MLLESKKQITVLYFLMFVIISISSFCGAFYFKLNYSNAADIKNYLIEYVNTIKNGINCMKIIKSSIVDYGILTIIIMLSSLVKFGPVISLAVLVRKCFVCAFSISAIIELYNMQGFFICTYSIPQILVLPVLAIFISVSWIYSRSKINTTKKDKIIYIIFSLIVFTIFCVSAIFEGIIATTFMKWIVFKVT